MHGISADWTILLESARRLISNGEVLQDLVNTINNDVINTQDSWQGGASQAYQEQWSTMLPQFKQAADNITIMGTQITNYVTAQQSIEQEATKAYLGQ